MDLGLRDRVCVVTGSTGGIGLATARLLGSEGARVVVCGRDSRRVETARTEAGAALGVVADLSAPDAPEALVNEATAELGRVDVLVNNIGEAYQVAFDELSEAQWEAMWQLNVMSYVRAIRAVLPQMRERRDGVIVNVSSTAGKPTATDAWLADGGLADQQAARSGKTRDEVLAAVGAGRPLGRLADPDEIAAVVTFLCSTRAAYVTGAAWSADGGTVPIIV